MNRFFSVFVCVCLGGGGEGRGCGNHCFFLFAVASVVLVAVCRRVCLGGYMWGKVF